MRTKSRMSVNASTSVVDSKAAVCHECESLEHEFAKNPGGKPPKNRGLIFVAIAGTKSLSFLSIVLAAMTKLFFSLAGGSAIALSALCLPFVTPALRRVCLPYVPATDVQVANVLRALKGRTGSLVDIGSGDGRIVST